MGSKTSSTAPSAQLWAKKRSGKQSSRQQQRVAVARTRGRGTEVARSCDHFGPFLSLLTKSVDLPPPTPYIDDRDLEKGIVTPSGGMLESVGRSLYDFFFPK